MKFNIGNKVRCLVDVNGAFSTKGKMGTIVECENDEEVYLVEFGKNVICYDEENYEFTNGNCLYVREKEIEGFEEDCTVEALIHPCKYSNSTQNQHTKEFAITQDMKLRDTIIRLGFDLTNYKSLA